MYIYIYICIYIYLLTQLIWKIFHSCRILATAAVWREAATVEPNVGGRKCPKYLQNNHGVCQSNQSCLGVWSQQLMVPTRRQREFSSTGVRQLGIGFSTFIKWNICVVLSQETLINVNHFDTFSQAWKGSLLLSFLLVLRFSPPFCCFNQIFQWSPKVCWDNFWCPICMGLAERQAPEELLSSSLSCFLSPLCFCSLLKKLLNVKPLLSS